MQVSFFFETKVTLTDRNRLKIFLKTLFKKEKRKAESLSYIFCSDEYLLSINQQYLQHDYYTDIITFNLAENITEPVVGDIYISVDRVKENAQLQNVSFREELHRVIFHGALHLCGYKDKTPSQIKTMRFKENQYLGLYFK